MVVASPLKPCVPSELSPPLNVVLVNDGATLALLENFLQREDVFGFDIETNVVEDFYSRRVRTLQFGNRQEQYVVDLLAFTTDLEGEQGHYGSNVQSLRQVVAAIKPYLEDHSKKKVGYNLEFEYIAMRWSFGIRCTGFFDLYLVEKLIYVGSVNFGQRDFWSLEDCVARYLKLQISKEYQTSFNLTEPLSQGQIDYGALDVRLPCAIRPAQIQLLDKYELRRVAEVVEFDAISAIGEMHLNGVLVDREKWLVRIQKEEAWLRKVVSKLDEYFLPVMGSKIASQAEQGQLLALEEAWRDTPNKTPEGKQARAQARLAFMEVRKRQTLRNKLASECEGEALINYSSNAQMKANLPKLGFTAKQLPNTDDKTLQKLSKHKEMDPNKEFVSNPELNGVGVIDLLRLHRALSKALKTYGYSWITKRSEGGLVDDHTGRIHPRIHQIGAATGRTSSSNPNSQNLPRDKDIRYAFVAEKGYKIITHDYSGCELRLLADLSGDETWIEAFANDWDVHSVVGELIIPDWKEKALEDCAYYAKKEKCKCPYHAELRESRLKILNFSIVNGKSAQGLAEDMRCTVDEASDILARWQLANNVVFYFLESQGQLASTKLVLRGPSGRWRRWNKPSWDVATKLATEDLKKQKVLPTQSQISRKYTSMFKSIQREGKNFPIQSGNADIVKLALYYIWRDGVTLDIRLLNTVHDEIITTAPEESAEQAAQFITDCMEKAGREFVRSIPMKADCRVEDHWKK